MPHLIFAAAFILLEHMHTRTGDLFCKIESLPMLACDVQNITYTEQCHLCRCDSSTCKWYCRCDRPTRNGVFMPVPMTMSHQPGLPCTAMQLKPAVLSESSTTFRCRTFGQLWHACIAAVVMMSTCGSLQTLRCSLQAACPPCFPAEACPKVPTPAFAFWSFVMSTGRAAVFP